eukprot:CAMPEP_0195296246 /NCGR_PEP_ID=MMETSP0707-20130614/19044_1 /TAXON_ID=33640 /ORGANISM="Asterionellopsis glacialis, Strain CCMP134" /LENGTH=476 /DNA_ID=CAMNT_0040357699 /DNA_START=77 /DNA_END=1507 /DNA_ORIENTATION=-
MNGDYGRDDRDDDEQHKKMPPWKTTGLDEDEDGEGSKGDERPQKSSSRKRYASRQASSGISTCSATEVSTVASTALASIPLIQLLPQSRSGKGSSTDLLTRQRQMLTRESYLLMFFSTGTLFAFLYFYLPMMALISLGMFTSSSGLLLYTFMQRLMLEYENLLRGRGIGDYLPQSLYERLAETTLHEFMMDTSFVMEYRHLLLYMIPGISQEQIISYVEQLPARHRDVLMRPGFGNFLGNSFMRLLQGDARYTPPPPSNLYIEQQPPESSADVDATVVDDDVSEVTSRGIPAVVGPIQEGVVSSSRRGVHVSPTSRSAPSLPGIEEDTQREQELEGNILNDAYAAMVASYTSSITSSATTTLYSTAARFVNHAAPFVIRAGLGITTISVGIGLLGGWYGAYIPSQGNNPSTRSTPTQSSSNSLRFPAQRTLLSFAFSGGASAGIMSLIRFGIRRYDKQRAKAKKNNEDPDTQKKTS